MTEEEKLRREQEERERIAASGFTPEEEARIAGAAAQPAEQTPPPAPVVTAPPAAQAPAVQAPAAQAPASVPRYPAGYTPTVADMLNATSNLGNTISTTTDDLAATQQQAGQARIDTLSAANEQYGQALGQANAAYQSKAEEVWQMYKDIVSGNEARIKEEQERAERERRAALNASKWTGLTELAASVANLIGVAGLNAVPQEYKGVQNDWMKKAEDDMKLHRQRMDNLNARLDEQKMRLGQLKADDARTALSNALKAAEIQNNSAKETANAVYENTVIPAQTRAQGAQSAAQVAAQGIKAAYDAQQDEDQFKKNLDLQYSKLKEDKRQFDQTMEYRNRELDITAGRYGLNPDGTDNPDSTGYSSGRSNSSSSSTRSTRTSSSGSSGNQYEVWFDGKPMTISMNTETRKQAILNGKEYIKEDVERILEAKPKKPNRGKDRREWEADNRDYEDVLDAIEGTGDPDDDNKTIESFIQRHGRELDSFNESLLRLAGYEVNRSGGDGNGKAPDNDAPLDGDELFNSL